MWSLVTLGSLRLADARTGDECLSGRRKELLLLAFLARRSPRQVPRTALAELLWGDKDEDRARASLRQALSHLRQTLGDALDIRSEWVSLSADAVRLDVRDIEDAAAGGRWNDVVAQWTGHFLIGQDDVGGESYNEWVDGERARLGRVMERAFAATVDDALRRGAASDAVTSARRWLDAFPDDEQAAEALTRALDVVKSTRCVSEQPAPPAPPAMPDGLPDEDEVLVAQRTSARRTRRRWLAFAGASIATFAVVAPAARQSFGRAGTTDDISAQTVIVPDFRAIGTDTVLAQTLAEALRIDLGQSRAFAVHPPAAVQRAFLQLRHDSSASPDIETARRIAARDGIKAVVAGEILASGSQFLLSVKLVATASGAVLALYSDPVTSRDELLPAVDRLAAKLRKGAGESLKAIESARPVEKVTSMSIDALSKYVRATRALDIEGAPAKAIALLEEAIALDSTFAMAYRRLAIELNDRGGNNARVRALIERAYAYRARLADRERYVVEAGYYSFGPTPDEGKAVAAYEAVIDIDPRMTLPLINLAGMALRRHQFARAESLAKRAVALRTATIQGHSNLIQAQVNLGMLDSAEASLTRFDSVVPGIASVSVHRAYLLYARGASDSAAALFQRVFESSTDMVRRQSIAAILRDIALAQGQVAEGRRWTQAWTTAALQRNMPAAALGGALDLAWITLWFDHDTAAALQAVTRALREHPLAEIPPLDRPYGRLIRLYVWAGSPGRARIALAGYDSAVGTHPGLNARPLRPRYLGEIALAERGYTDAVAYFREADSTSCAICLLPLMAIAYERMGTADSARVLWERYLTTPAYDRMEADAMFLRQARTGR